MSCAAVSKLASLLQDELYKTVANDVLSLAGDDGVSIASCCASVTNSLTLLALAIENDSNCSDCVLSATAVAFATEWKLYRDKLIAQYTCSYNSILNLLRTFSVPLNNCHDEIVRLFDSIDARLAQAGQAPALHPFSPLRPRYSSFGASSSLAPTVYDFISFLQSVSLASAAASPKQKRLASTAARLSTCND